MTNSGAVSIDRESRFVSKKLRGEGRLPLNSFDATFSAAESDVSSRRTYHQGFVFMRNQVQPANVQMWTQPPMSVAARVR